MANFCTNCGTKIRKEDNFCTNCGTRIDKSYMKENNNLSKSIDDIIEKEEAKIAKQNEEGKKKSKRIDEIFESEEIKSEIRKNNAYKIDVICINATLKNKIVDKRENMSEEEIKHFIKTSLEKAGKEREKSRIPKEKEMTSEKVEKNERSSGGYCDLSCIHCYEEFLDSDGEIVGDFDSGGIYEYYCNLGYPVSYGSFCEDYE